MIDEVPANTLKSLALSADATFVAAHENADRSDRIAAVLGREFDLLVHQTGDTVDAGLLAALAGTVRAGGLLVLGIPFALDAARCGGSTAAQDRFEQRMARHLLSSAHRYREKIRVIKATDLSSHDFHSLVAHARKYPQQDSARPTDLPARHRTLDAAASQQDDILADAVRHLQQEPRGCITITGRRGRGKSALLGRIAHNLQQQAVSVAVTAARRSAVQGVEKHAEGIHFVPAQDAVRSGCQVLLVDEAASLPVDTLTAYLQQHEHVIYATTVEGYEQAGRAFDIRFTAALEQQRDVLTLQPDIAWRWSPGDALEEFLDTLLLVRRPGSCHGESCSQQSESPQGLCRGPNKDSETVSASPVVRRLDRDELAQDDTLLSGVFSLLRENHYQTSASDIAHLLDGPDLQIWVLAEGSGIRAAMLLAIEGALDIDLHDAIVSKQRRLPHHLLPQLLAQSANRTEPLRSRMGRVIRIAVKPDCRRRGLGSRLLQEVTGSLARCSAPLSAIGASFAGDETNLAFWSANGFTRFHTGFRRNPRTGTQAVAVLKALDSDVDDALLEAARIHDDNHKWLQGLDPATADDPVDVSLLQRFASAERSLMDTYAALSRLAMRYPLTLSPPAGVHRRQHEEALRALVQGVLVSDDQHLRSNN